MASTPLRNVRIADDLWNAAQAEAERRGVSVSDLIRESLERIVRRKA